MALDGPRRRRRALALAGGGGDGDLGGDDATGPRRRRQPDGREEAVIATRTAPSTRSRSTRGGAGRGHDPLGLPAAATPASRRRRGGGQGSGFVVSDEGEIVTNAHVVTDAEASGGGTSTRPRRSTSSSPTATRSRPRSSASTRTPTSRCSRSTPRGSTCSRSSSATSEDVEVGQPVAAIGSPFGEEQSLSVGVVSATDRSIESLTEFQIDGAIQTDASINPGNSGGPLLDAEGHVIGINQQINTTSGGERGRRLRRPDRPVERSIEQLRDDGDVEYAYIGVDPGALPAARRRSARHRRPGALVAEVVPGGPADEAGIEAGTRSSASRAGTSTRRRRDRRRRRPRSSARATSPRLIAQPAPATP